MSGIDTTDQPQRGVWQRMAADVSEIFLYGVVGSQADVNPKLLAEELKQAEGDSLRIRMSSEGGDAFAGIAMFNLLMEQDRPIETVNDGVTASAMTLPFLAGSKRRMARGSRLMIHNPHALMVVEPTDEAEEEFASRLEQLRETRNQAAAIYSQRANVTLKQAGEMMRKTTWMTASAAKKNGFATEAGDFSVSMRINRDLVRDFEYLAALPDELFLTDPVADTATPNVDRLRSQWSQQLLTEELDTCRCS